MLFREKVFSLGTVYTIILLISIFSILGNNPERKKNKLKLIEKSGLIYEVGTETPFTGAVKDTVQDKIIEYYLIDGKKYGDFKVSNLKGVVEINGVMNNNKNEGVWNYFYPNGKLESQGTFFNDEANGIWKWYFPDGKLKAQGYFENNKKVGTWQFFNNQNQLIREISFKNDVIELVRSYEFKISI
uniref:MORN repeat protein n=1 Tax=Ignavibacterium album TaxID=591197 RepID=A0A7V3E6Z9_9BACT